MVRRSNALRAAIHKSTQPEIVKFQKSWDYTTATATHSLKLSKFEINLQAFSKIGKYFSENLKFTLQWCNICKTCIWTPLFPKTLHKYNFPSDEGNKP